RMAGARCPRCRRFLARLPPLRWPASRRLAASGGIGSGWRCPAIQTRCSCRCPYLYVVALSFREYHSHFESSSLNGMATDLKGRMPQDGDGRPPRGGRGGQARPRLARAAVVQAARALFLQRGYAATTIEAISDASDVPPATVYRLFSSKL